MGHLAFHADLAGALGYDHDLLLRVLMRRVRAHARFQKQAAGGQGFQMTGGAIVIDPKVAKGLAVQFRLIGIQRAVGKPFGAGRPVCREHAEASASQ